MNNAEIKQCWLAQITRRNKQPNENEAYLQKHGLSKPKIYNPNARVSSTVVACVRPSKNEWFNYIRKAVQNG